MRIFARTLGVTAAAAAVMAMGAPAFAGEDEHMPSHVLATQSESGDGGDGGETANVLSCLINLPIVSPNSDQTCNPTADGGGAESEAEVGGE